LNNKVIEILKLLITANTKYGIIEWKLIKAMRLAIKLKKYVNEKDKQLELI
jgi:hypothetical protein